MPRSPATEAARPPEGAASADDDRPPPRRHASSERMVSLGRLAAGVAHEINNPLAYVLGSIELVERSLSEIASLESERAASLAADSLPAIATAKEGVERIRDIVRGLTSFAHSSPQPHRPIDLEAVLDSAIELTWNHVRHRARVIKDLGGIPELLADESSLAKVFVNLILNASQAIPDGRQGVIRISTKSEGSHVVVTIEDDGIGIAPEDLPHVFEPFFAPKARASGSGLGLAICRNVVTGLGGTVTVVSELGAGSRFTVTLPAAGAVDAPAEGNRARGRDRVTNRARILIIDDEPLLGQTLRFAFQDRHDVEVASNGREAIDRLATDSAFDLVLCDLMMPEVSGEHVFRAVLERAPGLLPRFVFMTGGAFTERAQEFLSHFPGRQLEKPFNIDEVEALLSELAAVGAA